ncbi:isopeptide-forming domain-containing fimbrial protein [Bacillus toyonensis]|uniref:isopeptide-forming domain-containing fimbrial protein n=1 Tax=Bacillus toyonensis TaxID=155322 RepID=UPI00163A6336|nr:isopeptide-forming domain-containing fimbrial protein [Bacillus toyonensis]MBC2682613.1 isopeptide-forming domain-containing fimbrial protein [Bacillus toyonensis]
MTRKSLLCKKTRGRFKQIVVFFMMFLLAFSGMFSSGLPMLKVKAEDNTNTSGTCSQQQKQVVLINGDFEKPTAEEPVSFFDAKDVPGWNTTDVNGEIEIWRDQNPASGHQYAELNASSVGMLYQDVETTPGQTIHWRLAHKGRLGTDTMRLRIGAVTANPLETPEVQQMTDGNETWGRYEGTYIVPPKQTVTRFGFESVSAAGGDIGIGNFLDDIFLGSGPCVSATKSVDKDGAVNLGDELTYKVNVKNYGGDIASDSVFIDTIPDGTEYVPGSIKVTKSGTTTGITDAIDGDEGDFQNNKVTVKLGNLSYIKDAPEGFTVQFKVKVKLSNIGKTITNKAQIQYQDLLVKQQKQTETNKVVNDVTPRDSKLESEKIAKNLQNKSIEVGDEIEYTIRTRSTISDSLAKNVVIEDTLPEGLDYVPGTLRVDGKVVTDAADTDKGQFEKGKVTGKLGDVTDTEWHAVKFHAKVKAGQAGKDIQNKAKVIGENVTSQEPQVKVKVYPRDSKLESEKTAKNLPNKNIEVGDEIKYTIKTRNTVSDSLVQNLVIEDTLPEGLEYVSGTLQVDGKAVTDAADTDKGQFEKGKVTGKLGNVTDTEWHTVVFHAKIKLGQFGKTITNTAEVTGEGISRQTPKTDVFVGPEKLADKPVINPIKDTDKEITGTGTPGDEIIVKDPIGKEIGKTTVDKDRKWKLDVPEGTKLTKGDEITAVAKKFGSESNSEPAKTIVTGEEKPANKPLIDSIKDTDKEITGTGTPGDKIIVKDPTGKEIGKTTVDKDGKWKLDVPEGTKLTKGDEITAVAKKPGSEKESEPAKTIVTGEEKPVIDPIKDTDKGMGTGTTGDKIIVKDPPQTIDPLRILPSTGGQFSIALYAGGLLLVIGLLFLVRSKRKNN